MDIQEILRSGNLIALLEGGDEYRTGQIIDPDEQHTATFTYVRYGTWLYGLMATENDPEPALMIKNHESAEEASECLSDIVTETQARTELMNLINGTNFTVVVTDDAMIV